MRKIFALPIVIVGIGLLILLLAKPFGNFSYINSTTNPVSDKSEYDVFSDPNVLWGSEDEFGLIDMGFQGGTVLFSPGLIELMSEANKNNIIFFTVRKHGVVEDRCEDIVQDCLVKLTEKVSTLQTLSEPALVNYIVATARNTSINCIRQQCYDKKMCVHYEDINPGLNMLESFDLSLDDIIIQSETRNQIRALWPQLDEETRCLLEGKYYLGFSNKELVLHQDRK